MRLEDLPLAPVVEPQRQHAVVVGLRVAARVWLERFGRPHWG